MTAELLDLFFGIKPLFYWILSGTEIERRYICLIVLFRPHSQILGTGFYRHSNIWKEKLPFSRPQGLPGNVWWQQQPFSSPYLQSGSSVALVGISEPHMQSSNPQTSKGCKQIEKLDSVVSPLLVIGYVKPYWCTHHNFWQDLVPPLFLLYMEMMPLCFQ